jgi:hypothetical protein
MLSGGALEEAGGKILHFGPVAQILEGNEVPRPMAGVFGFPTARLSIGHMGDPIRQ